jgi:uncharacterized protein (TIGR03435 family)
MLRIAASALFLMGSLGAQPAPPSFEVASIKVNTTGATKPRIENDPIRILWTNITLQYCVKTAYGVNDYQISGPAWITSERYDVSAKATAPVSTVQRNQMMQALLADRFKLIVRRETRQGKIFALAVSRGGPKFRESKDDSAPTAPPGAEGVVILRGEPMSRLAMILSVALHAPVIDETGLAGLYDLDLDLRPFRASDAEPIDVANAIFSALQSELGLRLTPKTGPIDSVIVEHAERVPSGN